MKSRKHDTRIRVSGALLAVAAAGIFSVGGAHTATAATESAKVRCLGVNACKGKSECNTASARKGRNACKGHGLLFLTREECQRRGGKIDERKS
jgi:hypothetical protein